MLPSSSGVVYSLDSAVLASLFSSAITCSIDLMLSEGSMGVSSVSFGSKEVGGFSIAPPLWSLGEGVEGVDDDDEDE